jgi:hypothetical protein
MPGLDPGIHQSTQKIFNKEMDCRVKPGNDDLLVGWITGSSPVMTI